MFGLKYSQFQVKTSDNSSINIWEYGIPESVKTDKTIIIVGTDAGNMSYLIWQAKAFVEKGIRVVSFDYRGFGKSSDFEINKDLLFYPEFAIDLDAVIKTIREKYPKDKLGLFALSMGTYISLIRSENIDFLIAEGFYQNPQKVVDRIKLTKGETVLLPTQAKAIKMLKPRIPTIIFCASNDKTTTTDDAKEFAKNNNVSIVEFNGDHLYGFVVMTKESQGDLYVERITDFLKQNKL